MERNIAFHKAPSRPWSQAEGRPKDRAQQVAKGPLNEKRNASKKRKKFKGIYLDLSLQ